MNDGKILKEVRLGKLKFFILLISLHPHLFLLSGLAEVCNNSKKRKEEDNCVLQLLCYVLRQKLYTVCYKKSGTHSQCKNRYVYIGTLVDV